MWYVAGALGIILGALWRGYVLSLIWLWFVSPAFGLKPITPALAYGLMILAGTLTYRHDYEWENKPTREKARLFIEGIFVTPVIALGIAWVVRTFWL